jgi:Rod binding domain-containing protein
MESDLFASSSFSGQSYLDAALATRPAAGGPALVGADPKQAAERFEAFFLSQVLDTMSSGESLQSAFGGGAGENAWKSFLNEAFADAIVRSGGVGLADRLMSEIIALQAEMNGSAQPAQSESNLPST